jgi:hypothetical protein
VEPVGKVKESQSTWAQIRSIGAAEAGVATNSRHLQQGEKGNGR